MEERTLTLLDKLIKMEYNSQKKKTEKQRSARKKGRNTKKSKQGNIDKGFQVIFNKLDKMEERIALLEGQMELIK